MKRVSLALAFGIGLSCAAMAQPVPSAPPAVEPRAVDILKAASARLAAAKSLSFTATSTWPAPARNGQPLFYTTESHVTLQRPNHLRVITPGDGRADEFYYDGKTMTAYVPSENLVATAPAPPTIDAMLDAAWDTAAIYFPFDDVIQSDPIAGFGKGLVSAFYVGQSKVVGGTVTDMVAIATENLQAEIWIGAADHLPRMVRAVLPKEPGQPQHETAYSNWNLAASSPPELFRSAKAAAARPMKFSAPAATQPKP